LKDTHKTNKMLLIPLSFNFLAKNIGQANAGFNTIIFQIKNNKNQHINTMVRTINFVFLSLEIWDSELRDSISSGGQFIKTTTCEEINKHFETETISFHINSTGCKYFTITISPQYDKINKDLWQMIPSLLPEIQSIVTVSSGAQEFMIENADIRKSNSQIVYFFSGNPNYTMQNWIKKHMNENDSIIENELKNDRGYDNKQSQLKLVNRERTLRTLEITLTNTTIPVNVDICHFYSNVLQYRGGVAGLTFNYSN